MSYNLEKFTEKKEQKSVENFSQKLKYSMMYYFKSRKSHENLLMFVMDV